MKETERKLKLKKPESLDPSMGW